MGYRCATLAPPVARWQARAAFAELGLVSLSLYVPVKFGNFQVGCPPDSTKLFSVWHVSSLLPNPIRCGSVSQSLSLSVSDGRGGAAMQRRGASVWSSMHVLAARGNTSRRRSTCIETHLEGDLGIASSLSFDSVR
eukprot:748195-Hanusia_phi.AAC.6